MDTLRNGSLDEQIAALRHLKNEIVGHDQRKERLVGEGVIQVLAEVLASGQRTTGKQKSDSNGTEQSRWSWSQEDEVRHQATLVVSTLANGGPALASPLLAADMPRLLLETLAQAAAPKLRTATLQALHNIAAALATRENTLEPSHHAQPDMLTKRGIDELSALFQHPAYNYDRHIHQQQLRLMADIIALSATTEPTKTLLCQSDILDCLAQQLASFCVYHGQVVYHGQTTLPWAPEVPTVTSTISAICAIISGSTYRAHRFFLSSTIRNLFPQGWSPTVDQRHLFGARHGFAWSGEPQLPLLHIPAYGTTTYHYGSRAFPAMAAMQNQERRGHAVHDNLAQGGDVDHANAVCSWLLLLARSVQGYSRLMALKLLALVNNAIDTDGFGGVGHRSEYVQKGRERKKQIAQLAVPLAEKLVQTASESKSSSEGGLSAKKEDRLVKEQACDVLALLIRDFDELQTAAVDAGAIKHVCPVLKKSFDAVPLAKPMWSAKSGVINSADLPPTHQLGSRGLPPEILHAMRCRQGALQAIAALTEKEDLHRKAIVEAGVVPFIFDSLKPFPPDYAAKLASNRGQVSPKNGNTVPVLLAACRAAKTMSRSVSLLRTSLIDAGIAKPIFALLSHANPEVQLAATDVCVNLLLEFSPMRDDLIAEGVIKTLARHARGSEMKLRLSSLWALKHLVSASPKEIKIAALEELSTGWLVEAIQGQQRSLYAGGTQSSGGGVSVGLSTPNAAGEQVDLLNPSNMEVDDPPAHNEEDDGEADEADDEDGRMLYDSASQSHYQLSSVRSTIRRTGEQEHPHMFDSSRYLASVRALETNAPLHAKQVDVAVQEQALDFVRNILNGEDCAEMFEHLLQHIGGNRIFELLTEKLAPVAASGAGVRTVYGPSELIVSTINILTHISNALPRHKQLLIAQKPLLQAWVPHFAHPDRRVRVACVWAVTSLTWVENDSDRRDARTRANELRTVSIDNAVRGLLSDADLDVKERAKTAMRQFEQL